MRKFKVFLSSAQYEDEFIVEREALPTIFDNEKLRTFFNLWKIEDFASPDPIDSHYLKNVENSDILLLLLGENYREAVKNEFNAAIKKKKKIFCFIKHVDKRDSELKSFINEVRKHSTTTEYHNFSDLSGKIINSLNAYYFTESSESISDIDKENEIAEIEKNERALRILVGIFDSGSLEPTQQEVIKKYIIFVLQQSDFLSIQEIIKIIKNELPYINEKIEELLANCLSELNSEGTILEVGNKYKLLDKSKVISDTGFSDFNFSFFYKKYTKEIDQTIDDFNKLLKECITQIIYRTAANSANISVNGDFDPGQYGHDELIYIITKELALINADLSKLSIWQEIIYDVLVSKEPKIVKWISIIFKSYWFLSLLGLDPEVIDYQKESLKKYVFYLDSHIVIRAMVNAGSEADICSEIVRLCSKSKIELRLSDTIFIEVEKAFESTNKIFRSVNGDLDRAISIFKRLNKKSDILDGYVLANQKNPNLRWESYLNTYYSPIKTDKLKKYIRNELKIKIIERKEFSIEQWGVIEEIKQLLLKERNVDKLRKRDNHYERENQLRTNEARQMAIIYYLRNEYSKNNYWFITYDKFIYNISIALTKRSDDIYSFPCFMKPARVIEILSQYSVESLNMNTFRSILLSNNIHIIANAIESEVIAELLNSRIDKTVKNEETLKEMYIDIVNRPAIDDLYQMILESDEPARKSEANSALKDSIILSLTEKVDKLLSSLEQKNKTILTEARKAEKQRKKAKYLKGQLSRRTRK